MNCSCAIRSCSGSRESLTKGFVQKVDKHYLQLVVKCRGDTIQWCTSSVQEEAADVVPVNVRATRTFKELTQKHLVAQGGCHTTQAS